MKYLKSLSCNHKYIHYHNEYKSAFLEISESMSPYFVCNKCGKSDFIYGSWLINSIANAKNEKNKKIAIGEDLSKYDNYTIDIDGICHLKGYIAYYVRDKYNYIFKYI